MEKLIITAAITGATTIPSQSSHLPITPKEIADEAVRAADEGAAVVHIHAREPSTGKPSSELKIFKEILGDIKSRSDVVVCITTGGGVGMSIEERVSVLPAFKPEMASFNSGSMNFGLFAAADRISQYSYEWEQPFIENTRDFVFKNTFADMEHICKTMYDHGTKPELEIYDVGQLYNARYLLKTGVLKAPVHMQFVMGVLGGIGTNIEDLLHLKRTADSLFGDQYTWSVIGVGYPAEFHLGSMAIMLGGHMRVGLEDNLRVARGIMAESNGELVAKAARLAAELGREIAAPQEARTILGLKGLEDVKY